MGIIVLISLYFTLFYIIICLVWFILGAIVSPTVFLPYASAAATFITVMINKYKEINIIINEGYKSVLEFV
jgi:hypothetical protein